MRVSPFSGKMQSGGVGVSVWGGKVRSRLWLSSAAGLKGRESSSEWRGIGLLFAGDQGPWPGYGQTKRSEGSKSGADAGTLF